MARDPQYHLLTPIYTVRIVADTGVRQQLAQEAAQFGDIVQ